MLNHDIDDKSNKFSTLASYIIMEGFYQSQDLDSISFQLVRIPYDIEKEIHDLEVSDMPSRDMIIRSLKGALPTTYN